MAGALLWMALCYQQENTLSENPRIRTPACVNMQKSYYLVKKAGRLVHSAEDELFSELETTSGSAVCIKHICLWEDGIEGFLFVNHSRHAY
jgi:hypothetical protein